MDLHKVEQSVDLKMAAIKAEALKSSSVVNIRKLSRRLTKLVIIWLFFMAIPFLITPYVLERLFVENRINVRLTLAAIVMVILMFAFLTLVGANSFRRIFGGPLRRSLVSITIALTVILLAGSIWFYVWLTQNNAAGANHLIWVSAVTLAVGLPSGWAWTYRYRQIRIRSKKVLRHSEADWRACRRSMIKNEVEKQQHAIKMAKVYTEIDNWKSARDDQERLNYAVQYMKN